MKIGSAIAMGGVAVLMLLALPLAGVSVAGYDVGDYFEFPPLTQHVEHAAFSWVAFIGMAIGIAIVLLPFVARVLIAQAEFPYESRPARSVFPWWGWLGLVACGASWFLSWTKFAWFDPFRFFIFAPLWFGYILIVNGLTKRRTGTCMMLRRPGFFALLFAASTVFWWFFEYLNRFVQNWYYVAGEGLSAFEYVAIASVHFSVVLPAVLSTEELLTTMPRITAGLDKFAAVNVGRPRIWALAILVCSSVTLALIGVFPDYLYPLLWISPLLVITSLQTIGGGNTVFTSLRYGYWSRIVAAALAALVCGFFWELWNIYSQAKWIYSVPFVGGLKIFEMPILGYAGYLPFGLECIVVGDALSRATVHLSKRMKGVDND